MAFIFPQRYGRTVDKAIFGCHFEVVGSSVINLKVRSRRPGRRGDRLLADFLKDSLSCADREGPRREKERRLCRTREGEYEHLRYLCC